MNDQTTRDGITAKRSPNEAENCAYADGGRQNQTRQSTPLTRIVLGIEYHGGGFCGFQRQAHAPSVQAALEQALSRIADHPVTVLCAGRTDTGVHALAQVVHFDTYAHRPLAAWLRGGNSHLPDAVRILWAQTAPDGFHARYSAIARAYRYRIHNRPTSSALNHRLATWCHTPLDEHAMHQAAQHLLGEQDFSSFRAHSCQSLSPNRLMHFIDVSRSGDQVFIDLCANAFLHHMVRNIAGVLIDIGSGNRTTDWAAELLATKDRTRASATAPPDGLYLAGVLYPPAFRLPTASLFNRLPENVQRFAGCGFVRPIGSHWHI